MKSYCFCFNTCLLLATKKGNESGPLAKFRRALVSFLKPLLGHYVQYPNNDAKWYNLDQDATTNYQSVRRNYLTTEDNEPPPEIEYNYISRTRQDYKCHGENKYRCEKAIKERRVVDCSISRFRYIIYIIMSEKYQ